MPVRSAELAERLGLHRRRTGHSSAGPRSRATADRSAAPRRGPAGGCRPTRGPPRSGSAARRRSRPRDPDPATRVAQDAELDQPGHVGHVDAGALRQHPRSDPAPSTDKRGPAETARQRLDDAAGSLAVLLSQSRGEPEDPAGRCGASSSSPCSRSGRSGCSARRRRRSADAEPIHRPRPAAHRPSIASPVGRGSPSPSPAATATSGPIADRPARRRPDRPGHQLPGDADLDGPDRGQGGAGRDQRPLRRRSSSSRARPTRSWPPSASPGRPTAAADPGRQTRRRSRRTSPRTASASRSCAPTRSGPEVRALDLGRRGAVRGRPGRRISPTGR